MTAEALMLGVSGMRGTIGGSLTPIVVQRLAAAFAAWLKQTQKPNNGSHFRIIFGRDSRPSGIWVRDAAIASLVASGIEVIDLDIVSTPGVAMMVKHLEGDGGMIATASHNPIQWNGLKLLNRDAVAPPPADALAIIGLFEKQAADFVRVEALHPVMRNSETHALHIRRVLACVDTLGIASKRLKVVLDSVNGAGAVATATLLSKLGCTVVHLHGTPDGQFAHEPEPTAQNLTGLCDKVRRHRAAVGFAQDPDADRLAIVDENGTYIGEEYSLVLCAKWVLSKRPGIAVTNLSSSRMLDDVAAACNSRVIRTPVGEANVIAAMNAHHAHIGGEGNGGVIDPRVVGGRDSLVGIAYVLQLMCASGKSVSELVNEIPKYQIVKTKFDCSRADADAAVAALAKHYANEKVDLQDGIRIDWPDAWLHARPSNTEPIMRIIGEGKTRAAIDGRISEARAIVDRAIGKKN
jgi:phosphomannomutase